MIWNAITAALMAIGMLAVLDLLIDVINDTGPLSGE